MKQICYYREFSDDQTLPSIKDNISDTPILNKNKILLYLKSFEPYAVAPGSSQDIFTNEIINGSLCSYTDGSYVWLSDEKYYFEKYNLKLDEDFLDYVDKIDVFQNLRERLKSTYFKK